MRRYLKLFVCMTATLTAAGLAQTIDQPEPSKTSSPVAYVYVGGNLGDVADAATQDVRASAWHAEKWLTALSEPIFGIGDQNWRSN